MSAKHFAAAAMIVEFSALVLLMLRVSAFRVDRTGRRPFLGSPLWGIISFLPEKYNEDGKRLLRWAWALAIVLLANAGVVLWLFSREGH